MKVVAYMSSDKSVKSDRLFDLAIQKEHIIELAYKHEYELVRVYEEPEDSRENYKPALIKLIKDAASKGFYKVIVNNISVFGQDISIISWVLLELKKYNIQVHPIFNTEDKKDEPAKISVDLIKRRIRNKVRGIGSLPEVVTKVTELVQNPKSSASQLSKVISLDPGLTSKVLKLVNSAYYGFPGQISSIQHAVTILGFTTMRGLVLSSSIYKIFTPKNSNIVNLDYKNIWKHLLVTAIISKKVNKFLFNHENEEIFSSAILHDIGKIILDQYDHDNYIKVLQKNVSINNLADQIAIEEQFCSANHQEIGYIIAEEWNLPDSIADVIRYHHDPLKSENNAQLVSLVYVGNILSLVALDKLNFDINMFDQEVLDFLGLTELALNVILEEILEEIESYSDIESFFK